MRSTRKLRRWTARLGVERLEDRLTPATYTESATLLTINLTNAGESVSIRSDGATYTITGSDAANVSTIGGGRVTATGNTATVTAAGLTAYNTIRILDGAAGASVSFADSGANAY